jgi:acyl-CoA thioester hydrolase
MSSSAEGPPRGARCPLEGGREVAPAANLGVVNHSIAVRVYYEDTDAAGVVYYANYLKFMERARTEWLEARGLPLAELERLHGVVFVVTRAELDFRGAARLGDRLDVTVGVAPAGRTQFVARQAVRRGADTLVDGVIRLACVERATFRPTRVPADVARLMESKP